MNKNPVIIDVRGMIKQADTENKDFIIRDFNVTRDPISQITIYSPGLFITKKISIGIREKLLS